MLRPMPYKNSQGILDVNYVRTIGLVPADQNENIMAIFLNVLGLTGTNIGGKKRKLNLKSSLSSLLSLSQ